MSTRDREEIHWREMRKQLVEVWNRDGSEGLEVDDEIDLQARLRIPHHPDEVDKKSVRTGSR